MNKYFLCLLLGWSPWALAQSPPLTFTTSVAGTGNLNSWPGSSGATGIEAADNICNARAAAGGHSGQFVAYMSDNVDDAYCRAHGLSGNRANQCGQASLPDFAGPWVRSDGHPFGGTLSEMLFQNLVYVPPTLDEFGERITQRSHFGSTEVVEAARSCEGWTSAARDTFGESGSNWGTTRSWESGSTSGCFVDRPLLCMEVRQTTTLPIPIPEPDPGAALAFYDDRLRDADFGGVAEADQFCQEAANVAGFANANQFTAWLSEDGVNAVDRLTFGGPWVRPDGVVVAESVSELTSGQLFAPINVTADGSYLDGLFSAPWTGTDEFGLAAPDNCANWTAADNSLNGQKPGLITRVDSWWTRLNNGFDSIPTICGATGGFYCLGQASSLTLFADGFE